MDENLDNFETNKNIEISIKNKRNANNSNHLTHASLNFELNSLAGNRYPETSQMINDYRNKEFSTKFFVYIITYYKCLIIFIVFHYDLQK